MGVAIVKVHREALELVLPLLEGFGALVSVEYPAAYVDPCTVRVATDIAPGQFGARMTVTKSCEGNKVTITAELKPKSSDLTSQHE
jgi:hypothetical protein